MLLGYSFSASPLAIKIRHCLKRLPLLAIMPEDDQRDLLAFNQIKQFTRAGPEPLLILVHRTGNSLRSEGALQWDCVDSEEHRTGFWQTYQHCLVARYMAAGFNQLQSREQLRISIDQAVM